VKANGHLASECAITPKPFFRHHQQKGSCKHFVRGPELGCCGTVCSECNEITGTQAQAILTFLGRYGGRFYWCTSPHKCWLVK